MASIPLRIYEQLQACPLHREFSAIIDGGSVTLKGTSQMAYEHRDMSGNLFRNEKKTGNQPDYRGQCKIRGELLDISAWLKETKTGQKFFSFAFSEPREGGGDSSTGDDEPF